MSDDDTPILAVRDDAFIRAANVPIIRSSDGQTLEAKPVAALCRCGQSANKPYCDGSHKKIEFDGSRGDRNARDRVFSYEGTELDVHYAKLLCSHAGECGARLKAVFNPEQKPWIQPDEGAREAILDVVKACPSGALSYSLKGELPQQIAQNDAVIVVEKNGPYRVANIPLEGEEFSDNGTPAKYVLCRCGLSKNKPFCDGSHRDEGWRED